MDTGPRLCVYGTKSMTIRLWIPVQDFAFMETGSRLCVYEVRSKTMHLWSPVQDYAFMESGPSLCVYGVRSMTMRLLSLVQEFAFMEPGLRKSPSRRNMTNIHLSISLKIFILEYSSYNFPREGGGQQYRVSPCVFREVGLTLIVLGWVGI